MSDVKQEPEKKLVKFRATLSRQEALDTYRRLQAETNRNSAVSPETLEALEEVRRENERLTRELSEARKSHD